MPVKPFFLDLTDNEIDDIQKKTGEILKSGQLILGKYTKEFESLFAEYNKTDYAVSLNSGTSALEILLDFHKVRNKKIAVPSNTNFATVAAILRTGGIPVFIDMDPDYFSPNLEMVKEIMSKEPDIIGFVWVHIGGIIHPEFIDVSEYCRINGIFLIEDCAHAHGSKFKGVFAGNFADGGAYSFFPTKVMTTMEGGMIITNNKELADFACSMRNQGKRGAAFVSYHSDLGNSWRISEVAAYIGIIMLSKLDIMIKRRQFSVDELVPILKKKNIDYCISDHMDQNSNYKFIIRYKNMETIDDLKKKFADLEVILGGGVYEIPCHLQPVFSGIPYKAVDLKFTEKYCPAHICPPVTSGNTPEDIELMKTAIDKILIG